MTDALPIDDALPALLDAIRTRGMAVLQAPPGAGKTTRVPLALLDAGLIKGRIIMAEPRRIAARAAAVRMAATLGQDVGATVGYRMRGEARVGAATRIEVVTEGILTRMIQSDPALPGIGALIFDEFHERSLEADLGLALALELRAALRPDLCLIVMSATLDAGPVAALMGDALVVTSMGQSFPVEIRWRGRPVPREARIEAEVAAAILTALSETQGGILAFLPGEPEIRRIVNLLQGRLPTDARLMSLYGAMPLSAQAAVLAPLADARKVVLTTAIAETSLTIPDIRVVIDAGLARRSRFDPGRGMARLVTERVTRAEATQRAGRAGRVAPGVAIRLWTKGEEGGLALFAPPEITVADLAPLALELAIWGSADVPFLTPPPVGPLAEARSLLVALGALDAEHRVTDHGRNMAALPLHPRLAHMGLIAGKGAAGLAALLADRDPLRGAGVDITLRLGALGSDPALSRIRVEARRLARLLPPDQGLSPGAMAALAYPDRIGQRRKGGDARYLLSGGTGAMIDAGDPLAGTGLIVVLDTDGNPTNARIRLGVQVTEVDLRAVMTTRIVTQDICHWGAREGRVIARRQDRLGALVLSDQPLVQPPLQQVAKAMADAVRALGLNLTGAAARLATRVELLRAGGADLPDMSDAGLLAALDDWLTPRLTGLRSAEDWRQFDVYPALAARLDPRQSHQVDSDAPDRFRTPLGREVPLDYAGGVPAISVRLQEMFGLTRHPVVGSAPVRITLLSPGGHPIAITADLPGFWAGAYPDVRKAMRGRYPRHPWPDDPRAADPTLRAKPRGA